MKRLLLSILFFLIQASVFANMANPVVEGTLGGRPFVSQYVDVVSEDLLITLDSNFEYASFRVKYHINSSKDGFQIPFLFYASEYMDAFSVKVDGKEVRIQDIPDEFKVPEGTKFKDFSYFFKKPNEYNNSSNVLLSESPEGGFNISLRDMIYFEADISEGSHIIEVTYRASNWTDTRGWINKYSFRYALSPAKYWKSFGTLNVKIKAENFGKEISTNLGQAKRGDLSTEAEWEFNQLPVEILQIHFNPEISDTAQRLINITPSGLAYITGAVLALLHLLLIVVYRKRNTSKRFSLAVIIGSILAPLLFLISHFRYNYVIDSYIGEHASGSHGYTFLVIFSYPVIMPIYWLVAWFVDKQLKKRYNRK